MTLDRSDAELRASVFDSLENARANGYKVERWSAEALTDDLMTFDAVAEKFERDRVRRFVEEWLKKGKDP